MSFDNNKILWGNSTWTLLHTIAARINEDSYILLKNQLHGLFVNICVNLPCPECASHSGNFTKIVRLETIQTKQLFESMLFQFHNNVNKRINKPQYKVEDLVKYKQYNLGIVMQHFINQYAKRYSSSLVSGIQSTERNRKNIAYSVAKWVRNNWHHFN